MELYRKELEHATLISVGHRAELLTLHRHAARVEMAADGDIQRGRRLSRLLRRSLRPRPSADPSSSVSG